MSEPTKATREASTYVFGAVGELVMITNRLDFQLNQIVASLFELGKSAMTIPVVATLDIRLKLEMVKSRAKAMPAGDWKSGLLKYVSEFEKVTTMRNIVCHWYPDDADGEWKFHPIALSKMLKAADIEAETFAETTVPHVVAALRTASDLWDRGMTVHANIQRLNQERKRRNARPKRR